MHKLILCALLLTLGSAQAGSCPPAGESVASLTALKASGWKSPKLDEAAARDALALGLLDCLDTPDAEVRDGLAFEGLQALMRGRRLDADAMHALRARLLEMLNDPVDLQGFRRPFAALALADVVRADRIQPFMSSRQRTQIVQAAATYVSGVADYRGYDEREGWRHGVAHGADLLMQLALNPQLLRAHAEPILNAIGKQVIPAGGHFFHYGEGERLMAPVFYLARRGWLTPEECEKWLTSLVARVPNTGTPTQAGLAARHNVTAFLAALYVSVREANNTEIEQALLPGLKKALKTLG